MVEIVLEAKVKPFSFQYGDLFKEVVNFSVHRGAICKNLS